MLKTFPFSSFPSLISVLEVQHSDYRTHPSVLGRSFAHACIFFCALTPSEEKWECLHGLRFCFLKFFFITLELLLEMPSCKNVFQMSSFLWINLCVAPCCVPGHFKNETFFQEFYPAVNICIHQAVIKPNNFLISNAVCRSQFLLWLCQGHHALEVGEMKKDFKKEDSGLTSWTLMEVLKLALLSYHIYCFNLLWWHLVLVHKVWMSLHAACIRQKIKGFIRAPSYEEYLNQTVALNEVRWKQH